MGWWVWKAARIAERYRQEEEGGDIEDGLESQPSSQETTAEAGAHEKVRNYSGSFYFCQFIKSFWSLHSFWEEEDLSWEINTSFTEWHQHHITVIQFQNHPATVQWHTFKTFIFGFISSCSLQTFTRYLIIKYLINVKPITSSHKTQAKTFTWPNINMSFYAQ